MTTSADLLHHRSTLPRRSTRSTLSFPRPSSPSCPSPRESLPDLIPAPPCPSHFLDCSFLNRRVHLPSHAFTLPTRALSQFRLGNQTRRDLRAPFFVPVLPSFSHPCGLRTPRRGILGVPPTPSLPPWPAPAPTRRVVPHASACASPSSSLAPRRCTSPPTASGQPTTRLSPVPAGPPRQRRSFSSHQTSTRFVQRMSSTTSCARTTSSTRSSPSVAGLNSSLYKSACAGKTYVHHPICTYAIADLRPLRSGL
jgi:hypothetical protein